MSFRVYFSSSASVWDRIEWTGDIPAAGFDGWEIVADGNYRLDNTDNYRRIDETVASLGIGISVHAPYGDLNLATLNYPIWRESVRQICTCIERASNWTDRVTIHPGYLSPVGKMMPDAAWGQQKTALAEIGKVAEGCGVMACLENMIGLKEFLCREPGELLGMTEGLEGIGITIDLGHANTVGKVGEFLPCLARADHLHLHDNHGASDEHLPLGEGTIDWKEAAPRIVRDYHHVAVVEGRNMEEGRRSLAVIRGWTR